MKKSILGLSLIFATSFLFAQNVAEKSPAQLATDKLVQTFSLDSHQASEMLKIQERQVRNWSEIEPLKTSNPPLFAQKIKSMQYANEQSFRRLLNDEQEKILNQKLSELRSKKAALYKQLKGANAPQHEIEAKMLALDIESVQ